MLAGDTLANRGCPRVRPVAVAELTTEDTLIAKRALYSAGKGTCVVLQAGSAHSAPVLLRRKRPDNYNCVLTPVNLRKDVDERVAVMPVGWTVWSLVPVLSWAFCRRSAKLVSVEDNPGAQRRPAHPWTAAPHSDRVCQPRGLGSVRPVGNRRAHRRFEYNLG